MRPEQGAMDGCIPLSGTSSGGQQASEYKMASCAKAREDSNYQCSALNNHSITSGSSNQTELIRAYDFGKRFQHHHHGDQHQDPATPSAHHSRTHRHGAEIHTRVQTHLTQSQSYFDDDEQEVEGEEEEEAYIMKSNASQVSESDTQTDPGIRQFTKSPPRPNETRISACFSAAGGSKARGRERTAGRRHTPRSNHRQHHLGDEVDGRHDEEEEEEEGKTDEEDDEDEDEGEDVIADEETEDSFPGMDESESESVLTASPASTCSEDERSSSSVTPTNDQEKRGGGEGRQRRTKGVKDIGSDDQQQRDAIILSAILRDHCHPKSSSSPHGSRKIRQHAVHLHEQRLHHSYDHGQQQQEEQYPSNMKMQSKKSNGNQDIAADMRASRSKEGVSLTSEHSRTGMVGVGDKNLIDPGFVLHQLLGSKIRTAVNLNPAAGRLHGESGRQRSGNRRKISEQQTGNCAAAASSRSLISPSSSSRDAKQATSAPLAAMMTTTISGGAHSLQAADVPSSGSTAGGSHLESVTGSRPAAGTFSSGEMHFHHSSLFSCS